MNKLNVFIDTNVLLDVLCKREPFYQDSLFILKLCETGIINGYVSALSIADIVYILRKELDQQSIKEIIKKISLLFKVDDLKADDLLSASNLSFKDYEDALQTVSAKRNKINFIITRNQADFENAGIPALSPSEFASKF